MALPHRAPLASNAVLAFVVVTISMVTVAIETGKDPRMLLDGETGPDTITAEVKALRATVTLLTNTINSIQSGMEKLTATVHNLQQASGHGSTYVRWGRNSCPHNGSDLVYSGFAGASDYQETGGAANTLCLTPDPQWGYYEDAHNSGAHIYGSEYETCDEHTGCGKNFFGTDTNDEDMPCAVCQSPRSKMLMMPGRRDCYGGWTKEYEGYLMAGYTGSVAATEYICVDKHPNVIPGGHNNHDGHVFFFVEGRCGSLTCPPYVDGRELTCVVCTQ